MAEIRIDLDKKCKQCGKGGASQNDLCLACILKRLKQGKYDHILTPIKKVVEQALNTE